MNVDNSYTYDRFPRAYEQLLTDYRRQTNGFDELLGADGAVRAHWRPIMNELDRLGHERAAGVSERIQRRIVENGLTLDSFADPKNADQPWNLNLVPLVLPIGEWRTIEQAVIQRARLYELLLADLYGPQSVISEGLLPGELIFNDPTFLRPMHGTPAVPRRLMFMAADLARGSDGRWRLLDIHAETLAGHGYALANRVVLADVCARQFHESNALRISQFYQDVARELGSRANKEVPNIVILGPNPDYETYLSHAYTARYLGYPLVEGSDVRVVGGKLYHKTLAGLQPIDLVVRAVEALKSDPLELDPNAFDGPPALVQAARTDPGLLANALGTAIVENRGLAPYLAKLSQHLLGEVPMIFDAERLWLGDPAVRAAVIGNGGEGYLIRSAFEGTARPGQANPGELLSPADTDRYAEMVSEIELNGTRYVAEKSLQFATAPAWTSEGLTPRPYALRVFVAASGDSYSVMPGGIALTIDCGAAIALTSDAAESRDVWISAAEPQGPHFSRWRLSVEETQVQRIGTRLPSRVADNLYWLGRYVERADWTMRVMRNALQRGEEDLRPIRRTDAAESALAIMIKKGREAADVARESDGPVSIEARVEELFAAAERPYGIRTTFRHIRRVARQSRDRLSADAWRVLSSLSIAGDTSSAGGADPTIELAERLDSRIAQLAAFNGLMHENMTRNFGWRFLDLGRRLERAQQMAELLKSLLLNAMSEADETERLAFLLETSDSFMTYRARYRFAPSFPLVLDLLMVDETNPRSLSFQLVGISDHIAELPKASVDAIRTPEQRQALELLTLVRLADLEALRTVDEDGVRGGLADLLDRIIGGLPELSDTISRRYFSLTEERPHRVHTRLEH
ncbi:MAG: circularly permuted type 2 ATP-grasp protein [Hyphomicrobiaceae bacterium]